MIPKLKLNLLFLNVKMVKILKFKRRLKNLTNYYKRKVYIESGKIRLVVRISNKHVVAQLIKAEIKGDVCLSSVHSSQLKEFGWIFSSKNLPACYILGYMLGKKALEKGIKEAVLDIGLKKPTKGARIFAVAKGAIDAGMNIPVGEEVIPDEKRLKGFHVVEYFNKIKGTDIAKFQFSRYKLIEEKLLNLPQIVEDIIEKLKTLR